MISLRKMTRLEFDQYLARAVPGYAAEKQKGEGMTASEAMKVSEETYAKLLPQGLESSGQYLFSIVQKSSNQSVGVLWFAERIVGDRKQAYIYDFEVDVSHRGNGYGKEALRLLESEARAVGLTSMALHVFGHNQNAFRLYEKMGYRTTNIFMAKDL